MNNSLVDICHLANYNSVMLANSSNDLGAIIRQRRVMVPLTLQQLGTMSGVSPSHLGRIEKGGRFPSARVLRKIAKPLGFGEDELFALAGYLSSHPTGIAETPPEYGGGQLDPYVARVLAQEPVEVQRAIIGILTILKSIARTMTE
jgi:transcriptional regulator with XRE-family HTH domain